MTSLTQAKDIPYLYKETTSSIDYTKDHQDSDVLVVYSGAWRLNAVYQELIQYNQLRLISKKKLAQFKDTIGNYNDTIVYIIGKDFEDTLNDLLELNSNWESYTLENSSYYFQVYSIRSHP